MCLRSYWSRSKASWERTLEQHAEVNVQAFQPAGWESINHHLLTAQHIVQSTDRQQCKTCVKCKPWSKNCLFLFTWCARWVGFAPCRSVYAFIRCFQVTQDTFWFQVKCQSFKFWKLKLKNVLLGGVFSTVDEIWEGINNIVFRLV